MNRRWFALVLTIFMIPGCTENRIETAPSEALYETKPTEPVGFSSFYAVGPLQAVPLESQEAEGFRFIGDDILVFSGYPGTRLTLLDGDTFRAKNELTLPFPISLEDAGVTVTESGITYVDKITRELVFLDSSLTERKRIPLPEMCETPFLSADWQRLYYCTESALRVLGLRTGIDRPVAEMTFPIQEIAGLYCDDSVIGCRVLSPDGQESIRYLSAETGKLLHEAEETFPLWAEGGWYLTFRMDGAYREILCGAADSAPSALAADEEPIAVTPVLSLRLAILHHPRQDGSIQLDACQLDTGIRTAQILLPADYEIVDIQPRDDTLWLLCYDRKEARDALCRWEPKIYATDDSRCYLQPRRSKENPDLDGLAQCRAEAENLSERYGVQIRLWTDCPQTDGETHEFAPEYQVPLIRRMLQQLEAAISQYPDGFLNELSAQIGGIHVCLVRSVSPEDPAGFLYRDQHGSAWLVLTPTADISRELHRMLLDLALGRVLAVSDAFDSWDRAEPTGSGHRERVQLLAAAMEEDGAPYFATNAMQAKLRLLCFGIRETFHTAASVEKLPWERHLTP